MVFPDLPNRANHDNISELAKIVEKNNHKIAYIHEDNEILEFGTLAVLFRVLSRMIKNSCYQMWSGCTRPVRLVHCVESHRGALQEHAQDQTSQLVQDSQDYVLRR